MKQPSDKERLDWLAKEAANLTECEGLWDVTFASPANINGARTPREAIDAAMHRLAALRRSKPSAKGAGR